MELNEGNCHLLKSRNEHELLWSNFEMSRNRKTEKQKPLRIPLGRNLRFNEQIL